LLSFPVNVIMIGFYGRAMLATFGENNIVMFSLTTSVP
jgi:hypothetical protein